MELQSEDHGEEQYECFEKSLYTTIQRANESRDFFLRLAVGNLL